MASPVLLPISFRGISKTIGCPADAPFEELEDLLTALFLREEESVAGIRPAGFVLPEDVFVSLRAACADLQLLSASTQSIQLVVSFSQDTDEDEAVDSSKEETEMLQEFFNSLQQHGFLAGAAAEALTVALGFPAHRKTLMKAYSSYIQGDITVVELREELRAVSDDVSVGGSTAANAQKLVNYVKGVAADGFLSSSEEKFLSDAIRSGSSQLLNLFARAQVLGDSTVLNRGLVDAARAFSALSARTPLDDLDLSSGSDDADDEGDEDVDSDSGEEEEGGADADERLPRTGRPSNPTPSASELIRIIDRMYEDGSISNGEAEHLRHLATIEDEYVTAAYEVYEQDEDNDEDELKDTLIRIAKLSMPFTSKESADTSSEISLFDVLAFLAERQAVSKSEAAIIAAAIELDEPAIIEALLSFTENKSVPQFRAAFNFYLERSGMASSDDFQELVETADEETDASFAEDIAAAHGELIWNMFTAHLISKTEAILLMRLQDADDPAIAAAWHVYMETHDFNDLADTMLRILRREARLATQRAVDPQVSAIHELVQVGGLTPEEGTGLLASLAVDHKVLQAAFEAYHEDGNIDELVDTLKLIHRWTSQPAAAPHAAPSMSLDEEHPGLVDKAFISVCRSLYESGSVAPDEAHWLVELMHARDPRVLAARDVFASGRDEEELRDTLVHIAKLAAADPNFQQKYGVSDDVDGDTAAAAAASVSQVGRRTAPAGSTRAVVDLLEHVFAAPCEDSSDEFSSDDVSALVALARADDAAIGATVDVFHATNDLEDFRDSLQRIAKLASTRVASVVDAAPLAFSEGDKATLRRAARAADFTEEETKQLLDRAQRLDESVVGAVQVFNIEGDFNDLVDSLRRIQLRAAAVGTSPSVHAYYMQALSDLAATAAISGLQYQQLVQFVRASDPAAISAFDAFKAHGDKQRLRWELLGCLPKAATVAAPTEPEAASTSHHAELASALLQPTPSILDGQSLSVVNSKVSRVLLQHLGFITQAKESYHTQDTSNVSWEAVSKFAQDFEIVPRLCSLEELASIFKAVNAGEDADEDEGSLDQLEFNELLVRLAVLHCPDPSIRFELGTDFSSSAEFPVAVTKLFEFMALHAPPTLQLVSPLPKK